MINNPTESQDSYSKWRAELEQKQREAHNNPISKPLDSISPGTHSSTKEGEALQEDKNPIINEYQQNINNQDKQNINEGQTIEGLLFSNKAIEEAQKEYKEGIGINQSQDFITPGEKALFSYSKEEAIKSEEFQDSKTEGIKEGQEKPQDSQKEEVRINIPLEKEKTEAHIKNNIQEKKAIIEAIEKSQEENKKVIVQTLNNSIKPSIAEIERFILFLNNKFSLGLQDNLIVNIQDTSTNTKGFFMPKEHKNHYSNTKQDLFYICISSLFLKESPGVYEVIAHELGHYINQIEGHPAKNNYHHKQFKAQAEKLLLSVEKGRYGYNQTSITPGFIKLLEEFQPSPEAFHIFQHKAKTKKGSRNLLYMCSCEVKIRTAKNEIKPLLAICGYCNKPFILQPGQEGKEEGEEGEEGQDSKEEEKAQEISQQKPQDSRTEAPGTPGNPQK